MVDDDDTTCRFGFGTFGDVFFLVWPCDWVSLLHAKNDDVIGYTDNVDVVGAFWVVAKAERVAAATNRSSCSHCTKTPPGRKAQKAFCVACQEYDPTRSVQTVRTVIIRTIITRTTGRPVRLGLGCRCCSVCCCSRRNRSVA